MTPLSNFSLIQINLPPVDSDGENLDQLISKLQKSLHTIAPP